MKKYNLLYTIIATLACMACQQSEGIIPIEDNGAMKFEILHPHVTRATSTAFEQGDKTGLFITAYNNDMAQPLQISGNWANNVAVTFSGTQWTPEKKIFWSDGKMDVYAYYPYMTLTSINEQPFSVQLDQSTERTKDQLGGYEASDFLWVKESAVEQSQGTVSLQFRHCLSRFVVELVKGPSYEGVLPDEAEVFIHSVVPTATIDFTTGAVTKDLFGEMKTIKCHKIDNGHYEAVIVPQRLDSRRPFVEIVVNGVSYLVEDTFNFKAGMQHTYSLTINSNPDQVQVEIGGSISGGWN